MSSAQASLLGQALTRPDDGRGQALRLNTKNEAQVAEHQGEAGSLPLQPAELTFDPAKKEWFNVFGDERRQPGEWGHWRGRGMNWNSMCAHCHLPAPVSI